MQLRSFVGVLFWIASQALLASDGLPVACSTLLTDREALLKCLASFPTLDVCSSI